MELKDKDVKHCKSSTYFMMNMREVDLEYNRDCCVNGRCVDIHNKLFLIHHLYQHILGILAH